MEAYTMLVSVKAALAAVPGVKTCEIGYEANITPADYPLVRIVPSTITDGVPGSQLDSIDCLIYFGLPVHEFEGGLPEVYRLMLEFRTLLLAAARSADSVARVVHIKTHLDEDKIDAYKLMAIEVAIKG